MKGSWYCQTVRDELGRKRLAVGRHQYDYFCLYTPVWEKHFEDQFIDARRTVRFLYRIIVLGYKLFRSATALLVLQGVPFIFLNFTTVRFLYRVTV